MYIEMTEEDKLILKETNKTTAITELDGKFVDLDIILKNPNSFPEVDDEDKELAKQYIQKHIKNGIRNNYDIHTRLSDLSQIPISAFVGQTKIDAFDSEHNYLYDVGYSGKIIEWLVLSQKQNNFAGYDHFTGEFKVKWFNVYNNTFIGDLLVSSLGKNKMYSRFDESPIYKKMEMGINLVGIKAFKGSYTVTNFVRLETGKTTYLYGEFLSDFEIGKLNKYNRFLKTIEDESGDKNIYISENIINSHFNKISSY
jgi:hypothetical protein